MTATRRAVRPGAQDAAQGSVRARGGLLGPGEVSEDVAKILGQQTRRKYHNVPTVVDGQRFASKREAARYQTLLAAQGYGAIADLETQVLYRFEVNGVKVGRYTADFRYVDVETGEVVVEDSKGKRVRDWYRTKQLMKACHGIVVREV